MKNKNLQLPYKKSEHRRFLYLIVFLGSFLFVWQLGSTGLVDETPPLFAAAGRAMSDTGNWLTPQVNGLNRFDKPPLVYWLMGFFYSLPGNDLWDPFGTWAGRLPSALSSLVLMLFLGETVLSCSAKNDFPPRRTALITSLAFALSPLVMIWSRVAVSDALLCGTLSISLLSGWKYYINPQKYNFWTTWVSLGLAVLTKGPVAFILFLLTFFFFSLTQKDFLSVFRKIRFFPGILFTTAVSIPWYLLELIYEGKPFWDSFFGYHNFQRFTSVVNSHQEPWWFFVLVMFVSSLPFTPFLLLSLGKVIHDLNRKKKEISNKLSESLMRFSVSWLFSVFLFFTVSATKLPSYWLPAIPASAILTGLFCGKFEERRLLLKLAWISSVLLTILVAIIFWLSPFWLVLIKDPEIPDFGVQLLDSGIPFKAAFSFSITSLVGIIFIFYSRPAKILFMQLSLLIVHAFVFIPILQLGDELRQRPLRDLAEFVKSNQKESEPLIMIGARKPSLHFYTRKVILYEGRSKQALVNLSDRLINEQRKGWPEFKFEESFLRQTVLVVIDQQAMRRPYWNSIESELIGDFGFYKLLRVERKIIQKAAHSISSEGLYPNWRNYKPERF